MDVACCPETQVLTCAAHISAVRYLNPTCKFSQTGRDDKVSWIEILYVLHVWALFLLLAGWQLVHWIWWRAVKMWVKKQRMQIVRLWMIMDCVFHSNDSCVMCESARFRNDWHWMDVCLKHKWGAPGNTAGVGRPAGTAVRAAGWQWEANGGEGRVIGVIMQTNWEAGGQPHKGGHTAGTAAAPWPGWGLHRAWAEACRTAKGSGPRSPGCSKNVRWLMSLKFTLFLPLHVFTRLRLSVVSCCHSVVC